MSQEHGGCGLPRQFQVESYQRGEVIFRQGGEATHACIIRQGQVSVERQVQDETIRLAILGKGEVVGEMALVGKGRRTATVTALSYVEVVLLDGDSLRQALEESSPLTASLVKGLAHRLAGTTALLRKEMEPAARLTALGYLLQGLGEFLPPDQWGRVSLPARRLEEYGLQVLHMGRDEVGKGLEIMAQAGVLGLERREGKDWLLIPQPGLLGGRVAELAQALPPEARPEDACRPLEVPLD